VSLWRQLTSGLRAFTNRKAADQDISDEVESYLEQSAAAHEAGGLSPDQARRAARLELSSATAVREQVRSYGWENVIASSLSDLCYAARRLRGNSGFTAISVLTLALGIGASTAIFSVIEGVLLKPLPYAQSGQIVALRHTAPGIHIDDLKSGCLAVLHLQRRKPRVSRCRHVAGGHRERNGNCSARRGPGSTGDKSLSPGPRGPACARTPVHRV
jgi:hypothetical protein